MKLTFPLLFLLSSLVFSQHSERYVPETDPLLIEKLKSWQNLKFDLLMHCGSYSQWGMYWNCGLYVSKTTIGSNASMGLTQMIIAAKF